MGRYVGNKWVESLPSLSPADQIQGNNVPVQSSGGGSGGSPAPATGGGGGGPAGSYQTVNGLQTVGSMAQQLLGAGWGGNPNDPAAVAAAYAQTTGGTVSQLGGGGSTGGGGSSGGATAVSGTAGVQSAIQASLQPLINAFQQSSGFSIQQLEETKREFDANLQLAQDQMAKIGIPQLEINRQVAEAQVQFQTVASKLAEAQVTGVYNGQQTVQEKQRLIQNALAEAGVTGTFNGQPTEQAREFNANLGLNYLTQASQFAASNPFQLSNFLRGTGGTAGVPTYLSNLQKGVVAGAAGIPNGAQPQGALRLGDLQASMAGGQSPFGETNAAQQAINGIYAKGPNALAVGSLESLTPDELTNLQQGINNSFGNAAGPAFLNAYRLNPVRGQTAAQGAVLA